MSFSKLGDSLTRAITNRSRMRPITQASRVRPNRMQLFEAGCLLVMFGLHAWIAKDYVSFKLSQRRLAQQIEIARADCDAMTMVNERGVQRLRDDYFTMRAAFESPSSTEQNARNIDASQGSEEDSQGPRSLEEWISGCFGDPIVRLAEDGQEGNVQSNTNI